MKIQLSDSFSYKRLLAFTLPSMVMMIFTSIYSIVDGFFVSNYVGKSPFAAVNFIMPVLMILGAIGSVFGAGGSALIAKTLGEGKRDKANSLLSLFVCVSAILGTAIAIIAIIFIRPIAVLLGAEGEMLEYCVQYARIILCTLPFQILQYEFQSFFITAEKPHIGLAVTVAAGVSNMVLDALLVAVIPLGIVGAAAATAISQLIGGSVPIIYFYKKKDGILRFGKPSFDGKALFKTFTNGSSEFLSNISMSLVGMLYNIQLMKYAGEDGVAAYGVLMYVSMIFIALFFGYATGVAPVIGYHFGAQNKSELKSLLKKSIIIISVFSVLMLAASITFSAPLSHLFVGYDEALTDMTVHAFFIYSFSFLFSGIAIFGSSFFTALNNGPVSALISFLRTLVFQIIAVIVFPLIWGIEGIWISIVAAEIMAFIVSVVLIIALRKKYEY